MSLTIFAQRMKQSRERKGMKQNELAKAVKVTPTTISSYEKADTEGNGKKPTLENAQAIAETLGVSLDWLCGMSDAVSGGYTNFNAETYLKSIARILTETSRTVTEKGIIFENEIVNEFIKKIGDLLDVYHAGSIPKDLIDVCIDKIIKDYSGCEIRYSCFLSPDQIDTVEDYLLTVYEAEEENPETGIYETSVFGRLEPRHVKLFISNDKFDRYKETIEEVSENGGDNPT